MRKAFCLFVGILFCGTILSYASVQNDIVYEVTNFAGGLNDHVSPYNMRPDQGLIVQNVNINEQYSSLAKRDTAKTLLDFGSDAIKGLHRYYKSDATIYTIAATGTLLVIDNAGTTQTIQDGLSDGKWWQFITYHDVAIGANGTNQPVKWDGKVQITANTDGSRTTTELCAQLGAPFAELNTGTALDASSWYQYKMAFYDGSTYTYSNALSNPILTGADVHAVTLTDIPLGPVGTTHRYIYRTQGQANQGALTTADYYMCIDIVGNSTTTTNDAVSDATIAANPPPTWTTASAGTACTPPIVKYLEVHTQRLFAAGNSTYPSNIYWSDEFNPDYFSATDYEPIRPNDGDEVTSIKTQSGILRVLKTNTIQSYYTDGAEGTWYPSDPITYIGCPAPYSAINTPYGLVYLGRYGIYLFNGQSSTLISDAVTQKIRDFSQVNIKECAGYFHENSYYLSYTSNETGASSNNRVLIYDFVRDAYVLNTENINCFAAFNSGTDIGTLYCGSSTDDGYVFSHSSSVISQIIRYKSQLDSGTYSDAMTTGSQNSPILSNVSLDLMNDYSSDTLARADWVTSETTEKIPPDIGNGSDGAKTVSADETLSGSEYNYTSLTVDSGKTLTINNTMTIKVMGNVTIAGNINCAGTLNIYAVTITVSGSILGDTHLRANNIVRTGTDIGGIDPNTLFLCHSDGSDTSVAFTDSSQYTQTITAGGNAQVDTGVSKSDFEQSLLLDGNDYISVPNSSNFDFGTGAFTLDGWVNGSYNTGTQIIFSIGNTSNQLEFGVERTGTDYLYSFIGGNAHNATVTSDFTNGTWYHVAMVRDASGNVYFFVNGTKIGDTITGCTENINVSDVTCIGSRSGAGGFIGNIDEARISNYARWTDNFDVPIGTYGAICDYINSTGSIPTSVNTTDFENSLDVYSEGVTKTEGDYSLNVVCANGAITLNDTVTNTISAVDLTDIDDIYIDVKSNRTGVANFQLGISDSVAGYTWFDVPVSIADTWETVTIDISGLTTASKDAITAIALKFTDTDDTNVLHVDNIKPAITSATWTSPAYLVNASTFDKLYWNETLGIYGNVTFQMRTSPDASTWTAYSTAVTNPNGSDMSSSPAADVYCQFKINLTTTDGYYPPYLYQDSGYVFKLIYSKVGNDYETSVPSIFQSGWNALGDASKNKLIQRIRLYYTSDSKSVLYLNLKNQEGNINQTIPIDLSVLPSNSDTDFYKGEGKDIVYTFRPSVESPLVGQNWMYTITESGTDPWRINKLQFMYDLMEQTD